jgi:hypothetical protein
MIPVNHKSMMNVAESANRASESGAKIIVPNDVMRSPVMWERREIARDDVEIRERRRERAHEHAPADRQRV